MTSRPTNENYEAILIGGGPAGSTAACALAQKGHRVLVLERQQFPRFHIGESLLPASNAVFRSLGVEEKLRREAFVRKRGASFITEDDELSAYIDFTDCSKVPSPVTYQVPRARFDQLLLEHAQACGAEVRFGWHARQVEFTPDGAQLTARDEQGHKHSLSTQMVLDASGQAGFLSKRLGLRQPDPELRGLALHAQFEGIPPLEGERSGDIRIISRFDMGWIWLIPLGESLTSVGLVLPKQRLQTQDGESKEEAFERLLRSTPAMERRLAHATRTSPVRAEADFSYAPTAYAGDRWLLVGDAGSFLDPVFSTGVLLALESGLEAAEFCHQSLRAERFESPRFRDYENLQRRRYQFFRQFVRGFYDPAFRDLFFYPTQRFGLLDALVGAFAGHWRPSVPARARIAAFFLLTHLQRRFALVPRLHGFDHPSG